MAGLAASFGSGAMTNSIGELEDADCILVIGSNTNENHPVIAARIKRAAQIKNKDLIVVDPRKQDLVKFSRLWLRQLPGTKRIVVITDGAVADPSALAASGFSTNSATG